VSTRGKDKRRGPERNDGLGGVPAGGGGFVGKEGRKSVRKWKAGSLLIESTIAFEKPSPVKEKLVNLFEKDRLLWGRREASENEGQTRALATKRNTMGGSCLRRRRRS